MAVISRTATVMADGAPRGEGGGVTTISLSGEAGSTVPGPEEAIVPYGIFQFMNLANRGSVEAAARFTRPYILLTL